MESGSPHKSRKLEVILKLAEVCNIACTYCYYFFSGDDRPIKRPKYINSDIVSGLVRFVNEAYYSKKIDSVQIDLHGGEPLMVGQSNFATLCERLRSEICAPTRLCITTNAMLINHSWVELFNKYEVNVCISVDGPKHIHDRYRIDKKGRGTYDLVINGLNKFIEKSNHSPSALCVVDLKSDPIEVYDHLVCHLKIKTIDFLLPDATHDSAVDEDLAASYMEALIKRWLKDDDSSVNIRTFNSVLQLLVSGKSFLAGFGAEPSLVMTVGSDGSIDGDDFLKPCGVSVISTKANIYHSVFSDVFETDELKVLYKNLTRLPDKCRPCEWSGVCRGGQATHRYSKEKSFDNPSVYCKAQYAMFTSGAQHLIKTGVGHEVIIKNCLVD